MTCAEKKSNNNNKKKTKEKKKAMQNVAIADKSYEQILHIPLYGVEHVYFIIIWLNVI